VLTLAVATTMMPFLSATKPPRMARSTGQSGSPGHKAPERTATTRRNSDLGLLAFRQTPAGALLWESVSVLLRPHARRLAEARKAATAATTARPPIRQHTALAVLAVAARLLAPRTAVPVVVVTYWWSGDGLATTL